MERFSREHDISPEDIEEVGTDRLAIEDVEVGGVERREVIDVPEIGSVIENEDVRRRGLLSRLYELGEKFYKKKSRLARIGALATLALSSTEMARAEIGGEVGYRNYVESQVEKELDSEGEVREFHRLSGQFREAGFDVDTSGVFISKFVWENLRSDDSSVVDTQKIIQEFPEIFQNLNPHQELENQKYLLRIDPRLSGTDSVYASRFSLEGYVDVDGDGRGSIDLYDWVEETEVCSVPVNDDGSVSKEDLDSLMESIRQVTAGSVDVDYKQDKIKVDDEGKVFSYFVDDSEKLSKKDKKVIESLLSCGDDASVYLKLVPEGGEGLGYGDNGDDLILDTEVLRNLKNPISVNGRVSEVSLLFEREEVEGAFEGHFIDKYGNSVSVDSEPIGHGSEFVSVSIVLPVEFEKGTKKEKLSNLEIDLSQIGLGDLRGLIRFREEREVKTGMDLDHRIYSNIDHDYVVNEWGRNLPQISEAVKSAEKLFGFKPGERIQNVMICNASTENAYASSMNPDSIFFHDEILIGNTDNAEQIKIASMHEAWHCLDFQLGLISAGLEDVYNKYADRANLFDQLDEGNFLDTDETEIVGGHSHGNPAEFLASLLSSLQHPEWEKAVSEKGGAFLDFYQESLGAVKTTLDGVSGVDIEQDAPIRGLLDARIEFLKQLPRNYKG